MSLKARWFTNLSDKSFFTCSKFWQFSPIYFPLIMHRYTDLLFLFLALIILFLDFLLTYFRSVFNFYTPWKHRKTFSCLMFSGGLEIEHWLEMRVKKLESSLLHSSLQYLKNIEIVIFLGIVKLGNIWTQSFYYKYSWVLGRMGLGKPIRYLKKKLLHVIVQNLVK